MTAPSARLTVRRCDASASPVIRALFERNRYDALVAAFDRAYVGPTAPPRTSWIGLDEAGVARMHVGLFTREFHDSDGRRLTAGVFGDLLVDEALRDFWLPLKFFRAVMQEIRRDAALDCLYTDPTPQAAALLKATGFKPIGILRRHVMPTSGWYRLARRFRTGARRVVSESLALDDPTFAGVLDVTQGTEGFRPRRTVDFYRGRLAQSPAERVRPIIVGYSKHDPVGTALLLTDRATRVANLADAQWGTGVGPTSVLLAAAREAAHAGCTWLHLSTLEGSGLAAAALQAGFIARKDGLPIVGLSLRSDFALPPFGTWRLTELDGSAWC